MHRLMLGGVFFTFINLTLLSLLGWGGIIIWPMSDTQNYNLAVFGHIEFDTAGWFRKLDHFLTCIKG